MPRLLSTAATHRLPHNAMQRYGFWSPQNSSRNETRRYMAPIGDTMCSPPCLHFHDYARPLVSITQLALYDARKLRKCDHLTT